MSEGKQVALGCLGVILFVVFLLCLFGIQIVSPGQAALVTRFGHLDNTARTQGFYIEPLANVSYYDLKQTQYDSTENAGTKNLQGISVGVTVIYQLRSDKLFDIYQSIGSEDDIKNKIIVPNVSSAVKATSVGYTSDNVLTSRVELAQKIKDSLSVILDKNNIDLVNVAIRDISFTDADFNKSIEQKQIAEQAAEKAQYDLQTAQIQAQQQAALQQSLTPAILEKMMIDKWNGILPQYVGAGNSLPLIFQGN